MEKRTPQKSHINLLQEFCQEKRRRLPAPVYKTLEKSGPEHAPRFVRACLVDGRTVGIGEGKNQKEADNAAAEAALRSLSAQYGKGAPTAKTALPSDATPAARLHLFASKHPELGRLQALGASAHPEASATAPRFLFTYCLGERTVQGEGRSKDEAKHDAAEKMLKILKICK